MKRKILPFLLVCVTLLSAQAKPVQSLKKQNSFKVLSSSENGLIVELQLEAYNKKSVRIKGQQFFQIEVAQEPSMKEKGNPDLPKFTRSIMLPLNADFTAKVISSEYDEVTLPVAPSKGILSRTLNPEKVPFTFSSNYSKDKYFPDARFRFDSTYLIRKTKGVALNVFPFAYNPVKKALRVYKSIKIEITFKRAGGLKSAGSVQKESNSVFEPLLNDHFINYPSENLKSTRSVSDAGTMLIICPDDFLSTIRPFARHKRSKGLTCRISKMSKVGTSASDVKKFIQRKYDQDNSLTFVLLVGDAPQVPTFTVEGGGSDPSYSLVSGSDNYPDIIVGRFSAENTEQLETMVARSIAYENMSEQDWFHNGIGIASSEGTGDDNQYDWQHMRALREDLMGWHYTKVFEMYDGSQDGDDGSGDPENSDVAEKVNSGVSVINYTGHGSTTSWATTGFSISDVDELTNKDKLPFIFSVACVNGNFVRRSCFAESWLRATNSDGDAVGAIGFYGSSINQDWNPPMEAQDKFNEMLVGENYSTFGALCYNSSWQMMDKYGSTNGSSGANMFLTWHIFGDPSISVVPHLRNRRFEAMPTFETENNNGTDQNGNIGEMRNQLVNTDFVKTYPNPSKGSIRVEVANSDMANKILIYNAAGKLVYTNNNPEQVTLINDLKGKGLFFVKVQINDTVMVKKVVVE